MNSISFLSAWTRRGEGELLTAAVSPVEGFHGVFSDSGEVVGDIGGWFASIVWGKLGPAGVVLCEVGGLGSEYLRRVEEAVRVVSVISRNGSSDWL